jgi:hypothetical protein
MKILRDKYSEGICEFPGGKQSPAAERLAEEIAKIVVRMGQKGEEKKAA